MSLKSKQSTNKVDMIIDRKLETMMVLCAGLTLILICKVIGSIAYEQLTHVQPGTMTPQWFQGITQWLADANSYCIIGADGKPLNDKTCKYKLKYKLETNDTN